MKYLKNVASLEVDIDACTGCGVCIEVCPHNVLAVEKRKVVILDKDRCMECGACAGNCAFGALRVDKGVGCAAALINSIISGGEPSCDCSGSNKSACC
ncbi:MAG: 4Fe-4S binding protein [Nitrospirae bacterium]|nr:4Fe-4S binding protein [Nitrospirota bacterium]